MHGEKGEMLCYNRGCGQLFNPEDNKEDSCTFHSGAPFFHDAYKGWSCCKKKCTDFTEFLNIKGCTKSYHSNIKPIEPEKPPAEKPEIIEYRAPEPKKPIPVERPSFNTSLVTLKPAVSSALHQQVSTLVKSDSSNESIHDGIIPLGTTCKNNSCKQVYEGPETLNTTCTYHPGIPIFHEGLKYWSCCTKRTTDFNVFLEQIGCTTGTHIWLKEVKADGGKRNEVKCRIDWHQTPTHVYVSVFAKRYDPNTSIVQLSPVRLKFILRFPEGNGTFSRDMELRGIVNVAESSVSMLPTKTEIKLRKKEPGSWSHLDFPRQQVVEEEEEEEEEVTHSLKNNCDSSLASRVDAVDLSDL